MVDPEQALRFLCKSELGRRTLETFLPMYTRGLVKFAHYPAHILAQLDAVLQPGQPVGACFENDGTRGTIYYDPRAPFGVLIAYLFHEIVHAVDPSLWSDALHDLPREKRGPKLLDAEARAFEKQQQLLAELKEREPTFAEFLKNHAPQARVLHERLTAPEIQALYDFSSDSED